MNFTSSHSVDHSNWLYADTICLGIINNWPVFPAWWVYPTWTRHNTCI